MSTESHSQYASFIWGICNLLRGPYKRNEYRKVILPLTVLRRFDCILVPTKQAVLAEHARIKAKGEAIIRAKLTAISGRQFYNLSRLDLPRLLDDPNQLAPNLNSYINAFSPNVRAIMESFAFDQQIAKMAEKNLLYEVVKAFCDPKIDLSAERLDNTQMGYIFEELIRIGAEQSNEEAGEHFTPREVIRLMVNLLLSPEKDLGMSHVVKTIYDPACGTGGMLSVAENYIRDLNAEADPHLFGQDWNDEAWAVCKSDMLIKGENAENIRQGDTFTADAFERDEAGDRYSFDYMLANPPFGVEWKQQYRYISNETNTFGYDGRFGAGLPRKNDGALLFLQHMLSKMRRPEEGGSRIAIVFNGSPLFTGDAGSGESNIRQWIIENDWLEAVVAMPEQLFYNTGIATYVWILTNRKEKQRRGSIQLIDGRSFWVPMKKSLGNKRRKIGEPRTGRPEDAKDPDHIGELTRIFGNFEDGESRWIQFGRKQKNNPDVLQVTVTAPSDEQIEVESWKQLIVSKVFDNEDFGFHKITVERPLRLNFQATSERVALLDSQTAFRNLTASIRKDERVRLREIDLGKQRQQTIRDLLAAFGESNGAQLYKDRKAFLSDLREIDHERGVRLSSPELKAVITALGERDETAEICRDRRGNPEPDPELRDTETVPLKESIEEYFQREVIPHIPDAWIDHSKTKVGYEIPLNRHFYRYEPPRPLERIEAEIKELESEIVGMLKEVTA